MINKTLPIIFILTLSACAAPTPRPTPPELVQASQPNDTTPAWRICWFRTTWPEGRVPRWEVDMLLAHRLLVTPEAQLQGVSAADALTDVLRSVPVPSSRQSSGAG